MTNGTPKYRQVAEAYAVAVRAGLITPCLQDENAFRKMLGLDAAPAEVVANWKKTEGVKTPITIKTDVATAAELAKVKAESEADSQPEE